MSIAAAEWVESLLGLYCASGLVFALCFLAFGIGRVDPNARGASLGFRLLILPGCVALWPLLLLRWRAARRSAREHP